MSNITQPYVRRPLYVDAVQVREDNFEAVATWCQGEIKTFAGDKRVSQETLDSLGPEDLKKMYIHVRVHHPKTSRQTQAKLGDWILYAAEQNGYKVYTPKAFENNFELDVEDEGDGGFDVIEKQDEAA